MKVKVKGLVFAGFAAAVFAQSAMATDPAPGDLKTVTSKAYVDSKFDGTAGQVIIQGTNRGDTNYKTIQDDATYINDGTGIYASGGASEDYTGAGALVSGKAVKQAIDTAVSTAVTNLSATPTTATYVDFSENNGAFSAGLHQTPATTAAELTGYDVTDAANGAALTGNDAQKLVTTGAVNGLILREDSNGATTIDNTVTNNTVPTSKNVYDFVTSQVSGASGDYQPVISSVSSGTAVQIGYKANGSDATWGTLAGTGYLAVSEDANNAGVYTVGIDSNQVASSIATDGSAKLATENAVYDLVDREGTLGTSTIGNQSTTLVPTSKNVYDFVNNGYQAKATGQTVQIGYDGGWQTLGGSTYVTVTGSGSGATVALQGIAGTTTDDQSNVVSTIASATGTDLPTVANVKTYVDAQIAALPTNATSLPAGCIGHYCALVATKDSTTGAVTYEWTVMAPTGN